MPWYIAVCERAKKSIITREARPTAVERYHGQKLSLAGVPPATHLRNVRFWQILLQKSKIERPGESRESRFLDAPAVARLSGANTKVGGRFGMKGCGPSCRHTRNASAVFKIFVLHPKKTLATISARFGSAVMSDLSPGCAPKRTSADHSEFIGSNSNCLADSSPLLRRCEVEDERDASGIAETMKVNPPRKRPKACAEDHTWARDISRVSHGDMAIKSWFAESLGLATMRILSSVTSLGRGLHRGA